MNFQETNMDNSPTCGKGLAENSILPGKLGELAAAMAENFEVHMRALDVKDPVSRQEYEVYVQLANEQRETAARLLATANEMAGARDLPMSPHSFNDEFNAQALAAFEKVVRIKGELLSLLRQTAERDQAILSQMRSANTK
jgi:hypothetical protein